MSLYVFMYLITLFDISNESTTNLHNLNELETTKQKQIQSCIQNITDLYFVPNEHVLYSQRNFNIPSAIFSFWQRYQTQIYTTFPALGKIETNLKFTAYILVLNKNNLEEHLKMLQYMDRWNARAKFVVLIEESADEALWKVLIASYVTNALVLNTNDMSLSTYFPYKYENLNKPFLETYQLGHCGDFHMETGVLNKSKVPDQWRNSTVTVAYMHLHPYIIDAENGTGVEIELVGLMKGFMKYNVTYSSVHYNDWGVYFPKNRSYSGPVGAIQNHIADFVIGHFHLRETERIDDFDTTFSYMDDDICWAVPKALIRSHWQNLMNIFHRKVWMLTALSMFVSYAMWQVFNWKSPNVTRSTYVYYKQPSRSMEVPFLSFLGLPIRHEPTSWSIRFLFLVIFVFSFVLVTGWKSYLIVSLTHDTNDFQISTMKDLVESDLTIGIYHELIDLHCADGTPESDFVCKYADRNLCDASHHCLDRTANKRDMCTIATKRIFRYMSPQKYRTTTGREMIYVFKRCIAKDYTVQYYSKGHPLFERSNDLLIWIRAGGFVDNLDNTMEHTVELSFQEFVSSLSLFEISVLGLKQLNGMFIMLLGGLAASIIVFLLELLMYRYRDRYNMMVEVHRTESFPE